MKYKRDRTSYAEERYSFSFACRDCGHQWTRTIATSDPYTINTPACPVCKKERKKREGLKEIIESGKAPSIGGSSNLTKALDATAEMVMQDYGMTDLKSPEQLRQGESQAPLIAPHLQRQADAMFDPRRALGSVGRSSIAPLVARAALSGAYSAKATNSPDPITTTQAVQRHADLMSRTSIINTNKE